MVIERSSLNIYIVETITIWYDMTNKKRRNSMKNSVKVICWLLIFLFIGGVNSYAGNFSFNVYPSTPFRHDFIDFEQLEWEHEPSSTTMWTYNFKKSTEAREYVLTYQTDNKIIATLGIGVSKANNTHMNDKDHYYIFGVGKEVISKNTDKLAISMDMNLDYILHEVVYGTREAYIYYDDLDNYNFDEYKNTIGYSHGLGIKPQIKLRYRMTSGLSFDLNILYRKTFFTNLYLDDLDIDTDINLDASGFYIGGGLTLGF